MNRKLKKISGLVILNLVFILLCFIALVPVIYSMALSFSNGVSAVSSGMGLLPQDFTFDNYRKILFEKPFLTWLVNSVILSAGTMVVAMGCSVTAAYAFSRFHFKGRIRILKCMIILNAFPQLLSMFALFRLYKTVGLLNSRIGLIIIYAGSMCIFGLLNMKGYFDTIPVEIEEASKLDGASEMQLLTRIILPLARPAIIVTAVMVLISVWNEYLFATTFMFNEKSYTLAGGLYQLQSNDYSRNWPLFTAASILVSIPILIIFFAIQKYMVSGLTAGGVKG